MAKLFSFGRMLSICVLAGGSAFGDILLVDPLAAGAVGDIQVAVDMASDGDTILILPGSYPGFDIQGKSLRMVAETPGSVTITSACQVMGLAQTQAFSLSGVTITDNSYATLGVSFSPMKLVNCAGPVHIQDCSFLAESIPDGITYNASGTQVTNCPEVSILDSDFRGGGAVAMLNGGLVHGGSGLRATNSRLAIWDSTFLGGNGTSAHFNTGGTGGDGLYLQSTRALLVNSIAMAGNGGNGGSLDFGGDGGDGIYNTSPLHILNVFATGGNGGASGLGFPGEDGRPIWNVNLVTAITAPEQGNVSAGFALEDSALSIEVSGAPGSFARLQVLGSWPFYWDYPDPAAPGAGSFANASPAAAPFVNEWIGPLGGAGTESVSITVPEAAIGEAAQVFHLLAVSGRAGQAHRYAKPRQLVVPSCAQALPDCDGNGVWDYCQFSRAPGSDCDGDLLLDACQTDCNGNGVGDACDIASGSSLDLNFDGVPDECLPVNGTTWYIDPAAAPGGNGTVGAPFRTIMDGTIVAQNGDVLELADGVYQGVGNRRLTLANLGLTIRSENGSANCTVDLQGQHWAFQFDSGAFHVQGIRFVNGQSTMIGQGGALGCLAPTVIENCRFESNVSSVSGGAIVGNPTGTVVRNSVFLNNQATGGLNAMGGAVHEASLLQGCIFEGNSSSGDGGAAHSVDAILQCQLLGNSATKGGAVSGLGSSITQCLIAGNTAQEGAGIYKAGSPGAGTEIRQCTFVSNSATTGGAIHVSFGGPVLLANSILASNSATTGPDIYGAGANTTWDFRYLTLDSGGGALALQNGSTLSNVDFVLTISPNFVDPDGADNNPATYLDNDYRLAPGSAQIDTGSLFELASDTGDLDGDLVFFEGLPVDLLGNPRRVDDLSSPDLGAGSTPLVDQGAFERQ